MAVRAVLWVALASAVSATEIGSYASWYEKYTASAAVLGANEVNQQIVGGSEPTELTNDVPEMWRWYRNVGTAVQAKAKTVMDEATLTRGTTSAAIAVSDFKTKYDAELKVRQTATVTAAAMDKAILTMYDVLGEAEPTHAASIPLWKTYRSFSADVRDDVKKSIVRAPFLKFFTDALATATAANKINTFAKATAFVADTQGGGTGTGKDTFKVWTNFKQPADKAELNALLVPVLKAAQA